ncbi:hypothetical protein BPC006_I2537 [Burkholderia pseudomallei BPC006]|nr:hypothetical protein BPC006_I2537 [Burkholderia pseudomallei BPC006]
MAQRWALPFCRPRRDTLGAPARDFGAALEN